MKQTALYFFFLFILISCVSKKRVVTGLPELAKPGQGGYVKGELIFPLNNKPTPQCHASTIAETPSGLVVAFFAGSYEKNPDVGIRVSRLEVGKWTTPVEVVNGVQNDALRYPCWNPVLFQPKNAPIILFYKVGPDPRTWWGMMMTSNDNGKTWGPPSRLGEDDKIGHLLGPVKQTYSVSRRYHYMPSSTEAKIGDDTRWTAHYELTKDQVKPGK
ncbi:MAG: exo-alpha-sialidase [Ferruginibacter sp.]